MFGDELDRNGFLDQEDRDLLANGVGNLPIVADQGTVDCVGDRLAAARFDGAGGDSLVDLGDIGRSRHLERPMVFRAAQPGEGIRIDHSLRAFLAAS